MLAILAGPVLALELLDKRAVSAGEGAKVGGVHGAREHSAPSRHEAPRRSPATILATRSARGITAKERARLADLVQTAQSTTEIEAPDEAGEAAREEAYVKALGALRVWYVDWSDMARSVIKRRDYLIRLGLAKRKSTKKSTG